MGDERPSDALQPAAKKRAGGARDRDDPEDIPSVDPGTWVADTNATRERRKVHARRSAGPPVAPVAQGEPLAIANPFAGIALSVPAAAPANQPPSQALAQASVPTAAPSVPADTDKTGSKGQPTAEMKADITADEKPAVASTSTGGAAASTPPTAGIFGGSAGTTSGFASLAAGGTSFGGFGGVATAGGGTAGGLFGSIGIFGQSTLGGGGIFGSTAGTGSFGGGFSFPKLDPSGSSLGQPLFGAAMTGGGAEEGGEGEEGAEQFEPSEDPSIKPVVQLPAVQKVTGEENEDTVYAEQGKLYEYDSTASKWLERGTGELRVNVSKDGSWTRMLMRQSGNLHLKLNARVTAAMPVQRMQGANGITFSCVNTAAAVDTTQQQAAPADVKAEGEEAASKTGADQSRTWAFRAKGEEKILTLLALLEKAKHQHSKRLEQEAKEQEKAGEEQEDQIAGKEDAADAV